MIRRDLVSLGVALVGALAAVGAASPSSAKPGRIVFAANRAPQYSGEIWAVSNNNAPVDLSKSLAVDVSPALSPDGTQVAFVSNRGGHVAIYVVGVGGTNSRQISPNFFKANSTVGIGAKIVWSRDGKQLVADVDSPDGLHQILWDGDLAGRGKVVTNAPSVSFSPSPDGQEIAVQPTESDVTVADELDVISASSGKTLWRTSTDAGFGWSSSNQLATSEHGSVFVYDEKGNRTRTFPGTLVAWSPDGSELATTVARRLYVRNTHGGAVADVKLPSAPVQAPGIQWLGNGRLRVSNGNGWYGVDVAHDRLLKLPPAYAGLASLYAVSADGNVEADAVSSTDGMTETLHVATFGGSTGPTLATSPPCPNQDPVFLDAQIAPDDSTIVYESACWLPNADIYTIDGDGTGLQQVTNSPSDEQQPSWSPDGKQIAFESQDYAWKCDGCPNTIWVMNSDGGGRHEVTIGSERHFDGYPTFSPDGSSIAFWRWSFDWSTVVVMSLKRPSPKVINRVGSFPAWGPSRVAFINGSRNPTQIDTVKPDGTDLKIAVRDKWMSNALAWSSTGRLAYLAGDNNNHAYLVIVGSGKRIRLGLLESASGLTWSPDASKLAFVAADSEGNSDVWTVDVDGSHLMRLTNGVGAIGRLSWHS